MADIIASEEQLKIAIEKCFDKYSDSLIRLSGAKPGFDQEEESGNQTSSEE